MTIKNTGVSCKEEIISFCTIRYSGLLLFISGVTVTTIPDAKACYLLDPHGRNCEGIAVSQGVSRFLKFMTLYPLENYIRQTYFSDNRVFYQIQLFEINLDEQSQASIRATYLSSRNALSQSLCQEWRREYAFLVSKTEIERPQKSDLPDYDKISQYKRKIFDGPYFTSIACNHCLY